MNGQAFPFAFYTPVDFPMYVKITITRSRDNLAYQLNTAQIEQIFRDNFASQYSIGRDFEGERYISVCNVESAADVKVEWSTDDASWTQGVRQMNFDSKISIAGITVVEG